MRSFNRAAKGYDKVAVLQRTIGQRMLDRLQLMRITPTWIVDLGAGTGYCSKLLAEAYPNAKIIAVDFAEQMLRQAESQSGKGSVHCLAADAVQLPLADHSCDFIFTNFMLPWCLDLERLFTEFQRVLKAGGLLMFSTLGPDTLKELRQSWHKVDQFTHVNPFFDMHDVGDLLLQCRFVDPVMDMEKMTLTAKNPKKLVTDLKAMGSKLLVEERNPGLVTRNRLQQMLTHYQQFQYADGRYPATFEIIYGHAWGSNRQGDEVLVSVDIPIAFH